MSLLLESMRDDQRDHFAAIWLPWLRETVGRSPEPEDLAVMADPARYYRQTGGDVFIASLDGETVGAVALKGLGASGFEFCKLIVTDVARGRGVGRMLVDNCFSASRLAGGEVLWLQSLRKLGTALDLYRKMGFQDALPPPGMAVLARTEIVMRRATNVLPRVPGDE